MGRIADLLEKKALGTLSEEEEKELSQLQAEAKLISDEKKKEEEQPPAPTNPPADNPSEEEEVEKMAQRFADSVSKSVDDKFSALTEKINKALEVREPVIESPANKDAGFFYDRALGKKVTVAELSQQKILLPGRKEAGKRVTEVTMRTVSFLQALGQKDVQKLQVLSEGTAADGGFLVPDEYANMIIEDLRDLNVMRQISRPTITITSDTFHLPNLASRPVAAWRNEKATKNTSTANFGENVFTPYSLAVIVGLSNELVADASLGVGASIVNYVANLMTTSINEKEEQAFWVGSGSGQPSGVDGGVYSLRTVSSGLTDASRADNLIGSYWRTPQAYRTRGVYVLNSSTSERIATLKDTQGNYLLRRLGDSPQQTLNGRPVYESNYLAGGTALFGDFGSAYQIVDREGISVRVSDEATVASQSAFERNLTFIRVEKRVDAELVLPSAVTKVVGLGSL